MASGASEFAGYGNRSLPKKAKRANLYPSKTAGRKLRAGYQSGTDDIMDTPDPQVFLGGDTEKMNEIKREVKRRYA